MLLAVKQKVMFTILLDGAVFVKGFSLNISNTEVNGI